MRDDPQTGQPHPLLRINKLTISIAVMVLVVVTWNITVAYVDAKLQQKDNQGVYESCHKIWAARGLYNSLADQNSIGSMQRAFEHGAQGAEVDLHYDVKMDLFIISHDHPTHDGDGNLVYTKKDGILLTLQAFLQTVGHGRWFWIDFKNLDKLSVTETESAIGRLLEITQEGGIRERLYIEGSNPLRLSMYTDAGFKTILGIHPLRDNNPFASIEMNAFKIAYYFRNITGIAMAYGGVNDPIYGDNAEKLFGSIPIFLFHVPDHRELLYSLMEKPNVRVVLVEKNLSINRYAVNGCEETSGSTVQISEP